MEGATLWRSPEARSTVIDSKVPRRVQEKSLWVLVGGVR
jgi:hypothetical protein